MSVRIRRPPETPLASRAVPRGKERIVKGQFGGLVTAMVTPFGSDGRVELGAAQKIAAWLLDNGSEGLVVTGTTGESPTLSDEEKVALWRAVVEAVGNRGSVIAGSGTNDTAHSI